jgi:hypothetical protein
MGRYGTNEKGDEYTEVSISEGGACFDDGGGIP